MPVYVDAPVWHFGHMRMCHMLADSMDELLEMADRIGAQRRWFQPLSHPHFDLPLFRRELAVECGALEVNRREIVRVMRRHRHVLAHCERESDLFRLATKAVEQYRGAAVL